MAEATPARPEPTTMMEKRHVGRDVVVVLVIFGRGALGTQVTRVGHGSKQHPLVISIQAFSHSGPMAMSVQNINGVGRKTGQDLLDGSSKSLNFLLLSAHSW